jgi:hypothetical protein
VSQSDAGGHHRQRDRRPQLEEAHDEHGAVGGHHDCMAAQLEPDRVRAEDGDGRHRSDDQDDLGSGDGRIFGARGRTLEPRTEACPGVRAGHARSGQVSMASFGAANESAASGEMLKFFGRFGRFTWWALCDEKREQHEQRTGDAGCGS